MGGPEKELAMLGRLSFVTFAFLLVLGACGDGEEELTPLTPTTTAAASTPQPLTTRPNLRQARRYPTPPIGFPIPTPRSDTRFNTSDVVPTTPKETGAESPHCTAMIPQLLPRRMRAGPYRGQAQIRIRGFGEPAGPVVGRLIDQSRQSGGPVEATSRST